MPFKISFKKSNLLSLPYIPADLSTCITPVIFRKNKKKVIGMGTAFGIANLMGGDSIFVTAHHVVEELKKGTEGIEVFLLLPKDISSNEGANSLIGVGVKQIVVAESHSDVALMTFNRNNLEVEIEKSIKRLPVSLARPEIGLNHLAIGYTNMRTQNMSNDTGNWIHSVIATQGAIEEIHHAGRDRVLSDFPSFLINTKFEQGMSGGPIFNQRGKVIGIISHGFDMSTVERAPETSYGVPVAALLEMRLNLLSDNGVKRDFALKELFDQGLIGQNDTHVSLVRESSGVTIRWGE